MLAVRCFVFLFVLAAAVPAFSQTRTADSILSQANPKPPLDTTKTVKPAKPAPVKKKEVYKDSTRLALEALPRESAHRSLIVPGLGQIHNGDYLWLKLPVIYGGYVTLGIIYNFEQQNYRETLHEVQYRLLNNKQTLNPKYERYPFETLVGAKDYYRRNRDLTILGFAAWHAFQVVEAYVDAKMRRYDVTPELGFRVRPTLQRSGAGLASAPVPSLSLALTLK